MQLHRAVWIAAYAFLNNGWKERGRVREEERERGRNREREGVRETLAGLMLVLLFELPALILWSAEEKDSLPRAAAAELFEVTGTKKKKKSFYHRTAV